MHRFRRFGFSHVGVKTRECSSSIPPITLFRAGSVFCLGTVAGVFGSLVGMGGAFVVLPMLSGPFALPVHKAIGTSMGAVMGTCVGGAISFSAKNNALDTYAKQKTIETSFGSIPVIYGDVNILAAGFIIASAAVFAVVGARCSKLVQDRTIKLAQGIFMMSVAPSIMLRDYLKGNAADAVQIPPSDVRAMITPSYVGRLLSIGVGSGHQPRLSTHPHHRPNLIMFFFVVPTILFPCVQGFSPDSSE
jgi:uncharacterized membrane protein YfcA